MNHSASMDAENDDECCGGSIITGTGEVERYSCWVSEEGIEGKGCELLHHTCLVALSRDRAVMYATGSGTSSRWTLRVRGWRGELEVAQQDRRTWILDHVDLNEPGERMPDHITCAVKRIRRGFPAQAMAVQHGTAVQNNHHRWRNAVHGQLCEPLNNCHGHVRAPKHTDCEDLSCCAAVGGLGPIAGHIQVGEGENDEDDGDHIADFDRNGRACVTGCRRQSSDQLDSNQGCQTCRHTKLVCLE